MAPVEGTTEDSEVFIRLEAGKDRLGAADLAGALTQSYSLLPLGLPVVASSIPCGLQSDSVVKESVAQLRWVNYAKCSPVLQVIFRESLDFS